MTEEKIKGALAKVSAEGMPVVTVADGKCVLRYDAAHYGARVSADFAALATVCSIGASEVVETLAPHAAHEVATAKPATQTVTIAIRPLPSKQ
jgi:hypothetical protein